MDNNEQIPAWAKKLMDNISLPENKIAATKSADKLNVLIAAAKMIGNPRKTVETYEITQNYNHDQALAELKEEWDYLKEFAVNSHVMNNKTVEVDKM
jgi:hypothetical protein